MRERSDIEAMRKRAYHEQGWGEDGVRAVARDDQAEKDRAFAAGVEAGILYALGDAGDPFPRGHQEPRERETVWCENADHGEPGTPHFDGPECTYPHFTDQATRARMNRAARAGGAR